MGETGCGKTRLIRYMCDLAARRKPDDTGQSKNLIILKVHLYCNIIFIVLPRIFQQLLLKMNVDNAFTQDASYIGWMWAGDKRPFHLDNRLLEIKEHIPKLFKDVAPFLFLFAHPTYVYILSSVVCLSILWSQDVTQTRVSFKLRQWYIQLSNKTVGIG